MPSHIIHAPTPFTYLKQPFGRPGQITNDSTSDTDSIPELIDTIYDTGAEAHLLYDTGAPTPVSSPVSPPQPEMALTTRGPLELYFPRTCDVSRASDVVNRLLGTSLTCDRSVILSFKVVTPLFAHTIKVSSELPHSNPVSLATTT
jgi:hypothetical protein